MEKSLREKLKKELQTAEGTLDKPRPAGAFTKAEFCAEMGINEYAAERKLRLLVKNGVLKVVKFSVVDPDGRKNQRGGYVLVPEGERANEKANPGA